jgi:hypothetical protein
MSPGQLWGGRRWGNVCTIELVGRLAAEARGVGVSMTSPRCPSCGLDPNKLLEVMGDAKAERRKVLELLERIQAAHQLEGPLANEVERILTPWKAAGKP